MDIQNVNTLKDGSIKATIDGIELTIPDTPGNRHRQMIMDWEVAGNTIVPYIAPPTYATADEAKRALVEWIDAFTLSITGSVPQDEKLSWAGKEAAARAYVAGTADAPQTAKIEGEASLTSEDPTALAIIIIAKADLYHAIITQAAGLRRATGEALDAADPVDYEIILDAAKKRIK